MIREEAAEYPRHFHVVELSPFVHAADYTALLRPRNNYCPGWGDGS